MTLGQRALVDGLVEKRLVKRPLAVHGLLLLSRSQQHLWAHEQRGKLHPVRATEETKSGVGRASR
jgi:hypothetical protein